MPGLAVVDDLSQDACQVIDDCLQVVKAQRRPGSELVSYIFEQMVMGFVKRTVFICPDTSQPVEMGVEMSVRFTDKGVKLKMIRWEKRFHLTNPKVA